MCLIFICQNSHPDYPMIIAANRDEFYARPTAALDYWQDQPDVVAGRDQQAGGSWLSVNRSGRFAAITNHRMLDKKSYSSSRGELVTHYLNSAISDNDFAEQLIDSADNYAGYNCIFGTLQQGQLQHFNNTEKQLTPLQPPGIHGLSNASLDSPWFKIEQGKHDLSALLQQPLQQEAWFTMMADTRQAPTAKLPDTGIDPQLEANLSPRFIHLDNYGTRCTTLITVNRDNLLSICERSYNEQAQPVQTRQFSFQIPL